MEISTPLADQAKLTRSSLWIEINLRDLGSNLKALKSFTAPRVASMAVVKANAYGHGLIPVAKALADGVEWFGVASLEEGVQLRKSGLSQPILVFGHIAVEEVEQALAWDLVLSVSDVDYASLVHEAAVRAGVKARVHVKIDTGMGRFGLRASEAEKEISKFSKLSQLELEGLYTHFPQAEKRGDPFTSFQVALFASLVKKFQRQGWEFKWVHAAGSSGIVNYPESHFNLVRPGIMLYGLYPDPSLKDFISLRPVLSLRAKWVLIKAIAGGESIGYGRTFVSFRDTRIGILPMGYSQGYSWSLGSKAQILFRGKLYPVVGRISMDTMAVDLGPDTEASMGDSVTLIGRENDQMICAEDLAREGGSIPYEVVTRLHPAIERVYL